MKKGVTAIKTQAERIKFIFVGGGLTFNERQHISFFIFFI